MDRFFVTGGTRLKGKLSVKAAKNALLPILACCFMIRGEVVLRNCPRLSDVEAMLDIIRVTGGRASYEGCDIVVNCRDCRSEKIGCELTERIRSSVFLLGPLLARYKRAQICYPGGCEIGLRPIDYHLDGLKRLGVAVGDEDGCISCDGSELRGGVVVLDFPSVGATENLIMVSALGKERTVLHNCAKEPEIVDLANFINVMGGRVYGAGSDTIVIDGVSALYGGEYLPIADRIVAGTYALAAAITKGDLFIENYNPRHLFSLTEKLFRAGVKISPMGNGVRVSASKRCRAIGKVETLPYPGFPTDLQPQLTAMLCYANGCNVLVENLFESRFRYTSELVKMGADITVRDRVAIVRGKKILKAAELEARDLRGGAALVLAALAAEGESVVSGITHIDRGYEALEKALLEVGAEIFRAKVGEDGEEKPKKS